MIRLLFSCSITLVLGGLIGCGSNRVSKNIPATTIPSAAISSGMTGSGGEPFAFDANPRDTLPFLASDALQGRGMGMPGLDRAADFIGREFAEDGLKPLPGKAEFFQRFDNTTAVQAGPGTNLVVGGKRLTLDKDFIPLQFSADGKFTGPVVFAGYGISAPQLGYDDYAGIDVKNKIVLVLRYEPADEKGESRFSTPDKPGWTDLATFTSKTTAAAAHGASALLLVDPPTNEPDLLMPFAAGSAGKTTLPVLHIKDAVADEILASAKAPTLKSLRDQINTQFKPQSMALTGVEVSGEVQIENLTAHLRNVMGYLPGSGPHADEYVVVGAHYDHLGLGMLGHQLGPRGSIYHGADDNASGTATVLELASQFAHGPPPARSIIFICFTAEEEGLIGSAYFANHPPIPLDKIVAMLNLDMVGRMKDRTLYIGGQGTSKSFDAILAKANVGSAIELKSIGRGGLGPSDHMIFANKRIPVLFLFTGLHVDYHRPTDVSSRINYDGIERIAGFCGRVIEGLTTMQHDSYIVEADKDSMHLFGSPNFGPGPVRSVILGVIPDYGSEDSRVGVLIAGTTPGTPAEAAGLQAGDLLVQFGSQKLENLMDLTTALARSKPGDQITVTILRGNQTKQFDVKLAERKG